MESIGTISVNHRFADKNVLVTGASAGVGQASAVRFVAEGATVFGLGRNAEGLKETAELVPDPGRFASHFVDMSDAATISTATRAAAEYFDRRIDVVCNVAGITVATPIADLDLDQVHELNQVNFVGPLQVISETLPFLPNGGASVIVNVCSNAATQAAPTMAAYAGSKAALVSASFSLSIELAPRQIRVVPISPSGVQTKMMWDIWSQVKNYEGDWYSRYVHPWGQHESGYAADLASFVAFAASEEARYWNGAEIRIDGGARASF